MATTQDTRKRIALYHIKLMCFKTETLEFLLAQNQRFLKELSGYWKYQAWVMICALKRELGFREQLRKEISQ